MITILDNSNYFAFIPHGHCYLWQPGLVWLHGLSDGLIALAYFSIPIALIYFVQRRRDLPYAWIFLLFGAFIIACGLTHVMEVWTLWYPTYWLSGGLKSVTALVSLTTAGTLIPIIPKALSLPDRSELETIKLELEQQVRERTRSLSQSEERLQLALDASGEGLWDWDVKSGSVYLNARYQEMLGYTPNELVMNLDVWENLIHPDDRTWAIERLQAHLKDRSVRYAFDYRLRCKSGEWKWVANYGKVVAYDRQGKPLRVIGIHTDISDRKATETALAESQQRYQNLVENSPDIIERFDLHLRHLYVSPALTAITGIEADTFMGKTCRELNMDADMINAWESAAAKLLATGERQIIEFSAPTLNGVRLFEMAIAPERDERQTIGSILCISRDITDRKQTETQLRELSARLDLAVQTAKMGIWDWDIVTDQQVWNDRTYELYGLPIGGDITYATWKSVLHPDDVAACDAASEKARAEDAEGEIEFRVVLPDGSLRYIESYFLIQRDAAGQAIRMLGVNLDISDRKKAEETRFQAEKLRLELNLLERILDSVLAGYWDWDIPNHREYMSPGLKQMLGYKEHELPNTPETWQELIFAEDLPAVLACFDRHVQSRGQEPYYNEVRYHHKNGSVVWVICAGQVIDWDDTGQPLRMIGCHVDITKLKQVEAQLQKNEAHLRQAQRIGKLGSWEFDLALEKITWSDQIFCIFGRDPALGTPKNVQELQQLFHPDDRALHQQMLETAIATAQPYDIECRAYQPNGTLVYIQAKGEPVFDASGRLIQLTGTVLDITDRKQTEAQLRDLSVRLTLALQSGSFGVWDWILDQSLYWDERVYEIYGLQNLGRPITFQDWRDLVDPDDLISIEADLQAVLRGERECCMEFRIRRTDGELRWIKSEAVLQRNEQGEVSQMIGINYDITDRKQAEAKLLQTTVQLEASNRELEAFAYSVSHDLRAPLRAIDGFSKALLEDYGDRLDDEGKYYFDRIRRNVQRMGTLIDDLLSLSRVSRYEMQLKTVNLSNLVQEHANELQASDPERPVRFIIAPAAIVSADPTLMRVVVNNLLANAWKFTSHHSSACIEFGIIKQDAQATYFVRDDGAGFDMTYASKLFGVFQRLHNTDEFPGTGIGLAIVQRAIHRHGGRVWAQAAIEQGATIYFTIPDPSSAGQELNP
ncbi:MAG: PAS domain-containing protein [Leptolyngbyaceae cyanobacterium bins.302]|nr:PAS domain-containing protein [Leptolyngbyaceae cyanobacterium bins.302]